MRIQGYSNYEIYPETGQVWSYKRNKFIKNKKGNGYYGCSLTDDNGEIKHWLLHRLIWIAVNGPIPDGMQVNHIDENKHNNSISNLNLMSNTENQRWGTKSTRVGVSMIKSSLKKGIYRGYQWKHFENYLSELLEEIQDEDTKKETGVITSCLKKQVLF